MRDGALGCESGEAGECDESAGDVLSGRRWSVLEVYEWEEYEVPTSRIPSVIRRGVAYELCGIDSLLIGSLILLFPAL